MHNRKPATRLRRTEFHRWPPSILRAIAARGIDAGQRGQTMSTAPTKPFFRCQVVMSPGPNGTVKLHIHRRDGTIEVTPAPLGVRLSTVDVEATQAAGSDTVVIRVGHASVA
jgi:hypothetical protein